MDQPLTRGQQNYRVALLGVTFMLIFTAFNSLQNSVSVVYSQPGFESLGKVSLLFLYFIFGVCTFFTSFAIRKFGYKTTFFISSLGYALYSLVGLVLVMWEGIPVWLGWTLVMLGAAACGASASAIWVAQGAYVSTVAGEERKTQLFGLFWMLMMASQILGNSLIAFVLGVIGKVAYFIVLTALGGVTIGFYATFVSSLVKMSLPQDDDQTSDNYESRIDKMRGFVFIALGVAQVLTGLVMNKFFQPFCKYKLAVVGTAIVQLALFATILAYILNTDGRTNYPMCFLVSVLWGMSETFLQTNTGSLVGKVFPGKVQAFGVFRIIFAFGTVVTIVLNITLESVDGWVYLAVIFLFQIVTIGISAQVLDLREQGQSTMLERQETNRMIPEEA